MKSAQDHEPNTSTLLASEAKRYQLLLARCMTALDQTHAALQQLSDLLDFIAQGKSISDDQLERYERLSEQIEASDTSVLKGIQLYVVEASMLVMLALLQTPQEPAK